MVAVIMDTRFFLYGAHQLNVHQSISMRRTKQPIYIRISICLTIKIKINLLNVIIK